MTYICSGVSPGRRSRRRRPPGGPGVPAPWLPAPLLDPELRGSPFALDVAHHGPRCTVRLSGELDLATRDRVRDRLVSLTSPHIVVDLHTLTFLDASGLSALVAAKRSVVGRGATWQLCGARGIVRRVIRTVDPTEELGAG